MKEQRILALLKFRKQGVRIVMGNVKMMSEEYFPGKGCKCMVHDESECACNADWTDAEIYKLRAENERLFEENIRLKGQVQILQVDNAHLKAGNSKLHFKSSQEKSE